MIKQIIRDTDPEVLITYLRAEIGEIIDSWVLYRHFKSASQRMQTDDVYADMRNKDLALLYLVTAKFKDDIIARVAELGDTKVGQLTFHFAARKFKVLETEVTSFERFVKENSFTARRNNFISHKKVKPKWNDNTAPDRISYKAMTKAIAWSIRLMKQFDEHYYGSKILRQWQIARKRRYDLSGSKGTEHMLIPHIVDTRVS